MTLRVTSFRKSATRTTLFMGCDREVLLISGAALGILALVPMDWRAGAISLTLWLIIFYSLRLIAHDPQMRLVYLRYIGSYPQDFYPARSTPFCIPHLNLKR
ncbi:conjugal transfer protein TrbD [Acetobacteraceae bacterium]|nr:conjugal transfer protein TrbD [Acetobacteraceae bacterium]